MNFLKSAIAVVVLAVIAVIALAHSGAIDVAANREHGGLVHWLLNTTRASSVEARAADIAVPDLDARELQLAGINDFDAMCIGCHGGPGKDRSPAGLGLNPLAPDLAELASARTPAQIYWVTRNGIRMTGMPAWSESHDDESLWPVVAFVAKRLPKLDAAGYSDMLASASGHGHHGGGAAGDAHSHDADAQQADSAEDRAAGEEPRTPAEQDHDHSTHEH